MVLQKIDDEPATLSDYGDSIPLDSLTDELIQQGAKSDHGDKIMQRNITQQGIPDIEDTPFVKFKNGTLNVSDFIDPRYCEYKFFFGQQIAEDVDLNDDCNVSYEDQVIPVDMSSFKGSKEFIERGKSIRKELELEICAPLKMSSDRGEESFANILVELCRRLNILLYTGLVREVPVVGRIGNEIVYGSVNELRRIKVSSSAARLSNQKGHKSHDIHLAANHSKFNSKPLADGYDHSSNVLQVSLNKDLLDGLLSSFNLSSGHQFPTIFSWICNKLSLDANETFSDKYLHILQRLEETDTQTGEISLPKGIAQARNLRDLVGVLGQIVSRLGLGDPALPSQGRTSDTMRIIYVARRGGTAPLDQNTAPIIAHSGLRHGYMGPLANKEVNNAQHSFKSNDGEPNKKRRLAKNPGPISRLQVFHHHDATFDRQLLHTETSSMLKFWHGQRKMSGPNGRKEVDTKCGFCPFRQRCPHFRDQYPAYTASGGFRLPSPDMP